MTLRHTGLRGPFVALLLCAASLASAQQAQPAPQVPPGAAETDRLYEQALQSISEGRKEDASQTLAEVIEKEPQHAGAYLEVALIQCSLGHSDEAERLFAIIETRFDPPQGILDLINEARQTGCNKWQGMSSTSLTIARGIDRNVNQGASNPNYLIDIGGGQIELPLLPEFLPQHDQYTVLRADHNREITANGSVGFAQFQGRRNDSLSQYDSAGLFVGVDTPYRFGAWTARTSGMIGMVTLGGKLYQRLAQVQGSVTVPLPLPDGVQFGLISSATRTRYLTLANFDSSTLELRGQLSYRKGRTYAAATAGVQADRAREGRPGGDRNGHTANLLVRRSMGEMLTGELNYSLQSWRSSDIFAPVLIDQIRNQTTHALRGMLQYAIDKNQTLHVEARVVRNRENISIFQYNNRQLQFGWQWQTR